MKELSKSFVPVADEVFVLTNGEGRTGDFFRAWSNVGLNGGGGATRQGTYCVTPSGELLGAVNSRNPADIARMMRESLEKWRGMTKQRRLRRDMPEPDPARARFEPPKDGLILRSYHRDFPHDPKPSGWMLNAWNTDTLWYTADEAKGWMPSAGRKGHKQDVPEALVRRLARFNLVDMVRGQTWGYEDGHVEKASLALEVTAVEGGKVKVRYTGEARVVAKGNWSVRGHEDGRAVPQERGFDGRLLGKATFDPAKGKFTSFDLIAVGTRWGGTQYNRRENDLGPGPMGVVVTLSDESDKAAPASFWSYPRNR